MKAAPMQTSKTAFGLLQIGILLLGLATAVIHLVLLNSMMGGLDPLFTLNGLGYLGLLAAYLAPIPLARRYHGLVRWALILYTLVTILAWVLMGERNTLGYVTQVIQVGLIGLLVMDR